MTSLGRFSAGGRMTARLARQQQRLVATLAGGSGDATLRSSNNGRAAGGQRAIISMATTPPASLAKGRSLQGSAMVPEKLVTMVPWVPVPLQPLMDRLHPVMIAPRRPMAWCGIEALNTTTNYGALCGHVSFAILTAAYLETDILTLRVLVLSGSTLNILFNLFRVVGPPVWIPIKWNVGFLTLNAIMVLVLMREREEAEELSKDPERSRIYDEIFRPVDLSPVNFLRLMDIAERRVMLKGNDLNQEGRPHEEVFLIVEGTAEVKSEGVAVSHLQPGGFVGSMAFNRFIKAPSKGGSAADEGYVYKDGGMFRKAWEGFLQILRREGSVVGEVAKSVVGDKKRKRKDTSEMERSHNTISATSDVVVYVWDMHALREFVKRRPMIGASLQKAIAVDLVNKVDQSRDHHEHYRQLLAEALEGGRVTSTERKNLHRYREVHRISFDEHKDWLGEHGWTEEEFEVGFQDGADSKSVSKDFLKYQALLKDALSKGEVKPEARSNLRKFRTQKGIDAQDHLLAIEKQGWTADDYEVGGKAWAADRYKAGVPGGPADFEETVGDGVDGERAAEAEKLRYRSMLAETLAGGVIQPGKKEDLARYREMHAISLDEHNKVLNDHGWDEEEFDAGFHKAMFFQQYAALVERELAKGEVKPKARSNLRKFRTRLNIDAQDHLLAVEKQGWTADEYEAGVKNGGDGPESNSKAAK